MLRNAVKNQSVNIKWQPFWYGLDQSIEVGDTALFYLRSEGQTFANGPAKAEDREVMAQVVSIVHPVLGAIRSILADGLDYSFFLENGKVIRVNAEEEPGTADDDLCAVTDWSVDVELHRVNEAGESAP